MKQIMIVDDSATSRMFIRRCLQMVLADREEAEYAEAGDGKDALAQLKMSSYDIIFADLNMPVMDGFTLLRWVKSSPKLLDIPVVIITSVDNPANRDELLRLGAHKVLSKPIAPAKLTPIVNEIFELESESFGFE